MKTILPPTLALFCAFSARADEPRAVHVSGTCSRQAIPDRGALTLTSEATAPDLQSAAKLATQSYEKLRTDIKKLQLADVVLETSEYRLEEAREWVKDHNVSKGFRARMGLRVTSSAIERLGEVMALAATHKIRDVGSLETFLSQNKLKEEQLACLEEAARDARTRAEKLASSLGARVGEVLSLRESWNHSPSQPMPMGARGGMALMKAADSAPSVDAGTQTLNVNVEASFALK
ncbi:MAG: SIMPL domain-containing protein [Bdellovibrionales bacterium]|nr:SIMPL domain-containing protein [Bdellovibrionales bacterium]